MLPKSLLVILFLLVEVPDRAVVGRPTVQLPNPINELHEDYLVPPLPVGLLWVVMLGDSVIHIVHKTPARVGGGCRGGVLLTFSLKQQSEGPAVSMVASG